MKQRLENRGRKFSVLGIKTYGARAMKRNRKQPLFLDVVRGNNSDGSVFEGVSLERCAVSSNLGGCCCFVSSNSPIRRYDFGNLFDIGADRTIIQRYHVPTYVPRNE
jgi:hypothetical protein